MTKIALITGVTSQNGAYLAPLLLAKGHEVHGVKRRSSSCNTGRLEDIYEEPHVGSPLFNLHYGNLIDATNLIRLVREAQPDEIFNLAAHCHVQVSFEPPEHTDNADAIGTLRLLEAVRTSVEWAFEDVGITLEWKGEGVVEKGYCSRTGKCLVEVDQRYFRPTGVDLLIGDASRAHQKLGWRHEKPMRELARDMVQADLRVIQDAPISKGA